MSRLTAGPVHGLFVLLGWAVISTIVAGLALSRRDVR
jgi:hypothetical protein